MEIGKMIHDRRADLGLTLEELGSKVGVGKSTVQKWENGFISNMKRDKIALLASALKINPVSFITGELIYDTDIQPYNPIVDKIPVLGYISAGLPLYAEEHIIDETYTTHNGGAEYFALKVKGDSMSAAQINEGNLIIVRRQDTVENGEIAVVMVENENATVKRYKRDGNLVQLIPQSFNPEHQIQIYNLEKTKINILGKVVECKIEF